jgi:hypothetical protein
LGQGKAKDAEDGLSMITSVFNEEQSALLAKMHLEIQILFSIFTLAVRTLLKSGYPSDLEHSDVCSCKLYIFFFRLFWASMLFFSGQQ